MGEKAGAVIGGASAPRSGCNFRIIRVSRGTFVRRYLGQLGIGQTFTHLAINGYTFALKAPS